MDNYRNNSTKQQVKKEICVNKGRIYNVKTNRCIRTCEEKNKVTHPVTKKCRQHCKSDKIRRIEDFRCVKTLKNKHKIYKFIKKITPKKITPKKPAAKKPVAKKPVAKKPVAKKTGKKIILKKQTTSKKVEIIKKSEEEFVPPSIQKELKVNLKMFDKWMSKGFVNGNIQSIDYTASDRISDIIQVYLHKKYKQNCPIYPIQGHSVEQIAYYKKE